MDIATLSDYLAPLKVFDVRLNREKLKLARSGILASTSK